MCNEVAANNTYMLRYIPECFKSQEMCDTAIPIKPAKFFPNLARFKTQEMCIEVVEVDQWQLYDVPDHVKVQEMCDKAVGKSLLVCSMFLIDL